LTGLDTGVDAQPIAVELIRSRLSSLACNNLACAAKPSSVGSDLPGDARHKPEDDALQRRAFR
jgi:hypothetical protein